jgi:hypothetical protein
VKTHWRSQEEIKRNRKLNKIPKSYVPILKLSGLQKRMTASHFNTINPTQLTSFPNLVCLAIQSDGKHPDLREILPLDQLVAIENVANKQSVQLVFQNGVVAEIRL